RLLHRWAREEALPLPSRTHPQTQKQTSAVYTEELTDLWLLDRVIITNCKALSWCNEPRLYTRRWPGKIPKLFAFFRPHLLMDSPHASGAKALHSRQNLRLA